MAAGRRRIWCPKSTRKEAEAAACLTDLNGLPKNVLTPFWEGLENTNIHIEYL